MSLAGTFSNCAGGATPWGTWLTARRPSSAPAARSRRTTATCSRSRRTCPFANLNPTPLTALGRFAHEAVVADPRRGAPVPHRGRQQPQRPAVPVHPELAARTRLHTLRDGGLLEAMWSPGVPDLSVLQRSVGTTAAGAVEGRARSRRERSLSTRKQFGPTTSPAAASSRACGGATTAPTSCARSPGRPTASAAEHDGQVWSYDPQSSTLTLEAYFPVNPDPSGATADQPDGPDNITVNPWGGLVVAEDGLGTQHLVVDRRRLAVHPRPQRAERQRIHRRELLARPADAVRQHPGRGLRVRRSPGRSRAGCDAHVTARPDGRSSRSVGGDARRRHGPGLELLPPPRRRRARRRPHRPVGAGEGDAAPRRRGEPPRRRSRPPRPTRPSPPCAGSASSPRRPAPPRSWPRRPAPSAARPNGGEVVDRIRAETGVHVEVIGGLEEARLIFGAVRASVVLDPAPALCFDLGGGSLEVMVGDASSLMWATSVPLGVARLTAELVHSDPISKSRPARAARPHRRGARARSSPRSRRSSPSSRSAAAARSRPGRDGGGPARRGHARLAEPAHHRPPASSSRCTRTSLASTRRRSAAHRRASTPAASTSSSPGRWCSPPRWSCSTSTSSPSASGRCARASCSTRSAATIPPTGPTTRTRSAAARCSAWPAGATGPSRTPARWPSSSLDLFDATAALHGLGDADRELLEFAALLHDIGEHVASSGHHKHGAYLVRNGQLRGFAPDEIELLAAVVRWHRARRAARDRRVPAARRRRDRAGARARRHPAGRRRPRPQPQPERVRRSTR